MVFYVSAPKCALSGFGVWGEKEMAPLCGPSLVRSVYVGGEDSTGWAGLAYKSISLSRYSSGVNTG